MQDRPESLVPTMAMNIRVLVQRSTLYLKAATSRDYCSNILRRFFAACLSCTLRCLAAFMSTGADVRTCFTCVGTNDEHESPDAVANQGATSVGMDGRYESKLERFGVVLCIDGIDKRNEKLCLRFTSKANTAARRKPIASARESSAPLGRGTTYTTFKDSPEVAWACTQELHAATRCGRCATSNGGSMSARHTKTNLMRG